MTEMNPQEDKINPAENLINTEPSPIELPTGVTEMQLTQKAIAWNAQWQILFDKKKLNWEQNYALFKHFDKGLVENISQKTYDVWAAIQSEIPHLINSIFTKSEIVKGIPKFEDINGNSYKVNSYINKMMLVGNQGRKIASDAIQDFLVFGSCISKTFYDSVEASKFNLETQQWEEAYEGKPSVYNVDIFNFAIDPSFNGHDVNDAEFCRERLFFTKEDLIKLAESGEIIHIDENELSPSKPADSGRDIRNRIDGLAPQKSDKVYVDEFWCKLAYKDETGAQRTGKYYFWLLNNQHLIKFKPNIFNKSPFKVARCYRLAHEFFGISDVDVMTSLSEHINITHTQGALLAKKTGQKLTILGPAVGIDPQQLKSKENGIIMVKEMSQIKTEDTTAGSDLATLINYKASLKSDLNNAVGINDIMRGEAPGDITATEASILNSNSSARLAMKLANFQDEWVSPIAASFYDLSKQFIDTYSFFVENELIQLTQADFEGSYDWVAQGSTALANRNLRIRQMTEIGQQLAQASIMASQSNGMVIFPSFDLGKFTQNEIMSLLEIQNPAQYFNEPQMPQMPQMNDIGGNPNGALPNQMPISDSSMDIGASEGLDAGEANSVVS